MTVLPASVRVALWGSLAFSGGVAVEQVPDRALPDLDHCDGLVETIELWQSLGERVIVPALPLPGSTAGMPSGSAEFVDAATTAGELIYVPGIGGGAVPRIETFGPDGDTGWQAIWVRYDADPMPIHRLEALDLPSIELSLRTRIATLTEALEGTDAPLTIGAALEGEGSIRGRLGVDVGERWGLPPNIPQRAIRLIALSGRLAAAAESGADPSLHAATSAATTQRETLLREIGAVASTALAESATVACLAVARG